MTDNNLCIVGEKVLKPSYTCVHVLAMRGQIITFHFCQIQNFENCRVCLLHCKLYLCPLCLISTSQNSNVLVCSNASCCVVVKQCNCQIIVFCKHFQYFFGHRNGHNTWQGWGCRQNMTIRSKYDDERRVSWLSLMHELSLRSAISILGA